MVGANTNIERANTRFAPTVCVLNDVAQTIHELSVRREAVGLCGAQNQLRIKNYELRVNV